ncbi:energy transducer TonB [bacterium]|nr:energy transducer TonB [bacterium]
MRLAQNPDADLKIGYSKRFELGLILGLLLINTTFVIFQKSKNTIVIEAARDVKEIQLEEVPITVQAPQTQAPSKPTVFVESENEELLDAETIDISEFDIEDVPPPPPPPPTSAGEEEEVIPFYAISQKPKVIGFENDEFSVAVNKAIAKNLKYPDMARKASIEGKVFIQFDIDKSGTPKNLVIAKDTSGGFLGQAALEAAQQLRFKPAVQNDRTVGLNGVTIPITFKLK